MKRILSLFLSLLLAFPVSLLPTSVQGAGQEAGNSDEGSSESGSPGSGKSDKDAQSKDFQVNLAMGAASVGIPIAGLAGKDGIQPSLGLSYSSDSGKGWVGFGFTLGSGEIVRKGKTGVAKFTPSNSPDADTFSLSFTGINSDLTPKPGVANEFVTDEEKFLKITKDEGGNGWTVFTPDGTKYEFGYSSGYLGFRGAGPNSQIRAKENATTNMGSAGFQYTRAWALSKVTNANGYWMEFEYTTGLPGSVNLNGTPGDSTAGGDYYLREVRYTYGPNNLDTGRSITFNVEFRCVGMRDAANQLVTPENCNNVEASYETGSYVQMDQRLARVEVFADRPRNKLYRQYRLSYDNVTVQGNPSAGSCNLNDVTCVCDASHPCNTNWVTPESKLVKVVEYVKDAGGAFKINKRWDMGFTSRPMGWNADNGQPLPFQMAERNPDRFASLGVQVSRVTKSARPGMVSAFQSTLGPWYEGPAPQVASLLESRQNLRGATGVADFSTPSGIPLHWSEKKVTRQSANLTKYKWNSSEWNAQCDANTYPELPPYTFWCACRQSVDNQFMGYFGVNGQPIPAGPDPAGIFQPAGGACWSSCLTGNTNTPGHTVAECQADKDKCGPNGAGTRETYREYRDDGAFMIDINGDTLVDRVVLTKSNQRGHQVNLSRGNSVDGILTCESPLIADEQKVYLNSGSGWVEPDANAAEGTLAKEGSKYTEGLKHVGQQTPWGPWAYTVQSTGCLYPEQFLIPFGMTFANLNGDKCVDLVMYKNLYGYPNVAQEYWGPDYSSPTLFPTTPPRAIALAKCDGSGEYTEIQGGDPVPNIGTPPYTEPSSAIVSDATIATNLASIPRPITAATRFVDLNGDGLDDFLVSLSGATGFWFDAWGRSVPRGETKVFLNTGRGWTEDVPLSQALLASGIFFADETQDSSANLQALPSTYASLDVDLVDLNNDHKPDFLSNCWVKINNGNLGFPDACLKKNMTIPGTPNEKICKHAGHYDQITPNREACMPIDLTIFMDSLTLRGPEGPEGSRYNGSFGFGTQAVGGLDGTTNVAIINHNGEAWPTQSRCNPATSGSAEFGSCDGPKVYLAKTEDGQPPGLLKTVSLPSGQTITFDYTSSADTSPLMPFIKNVVRSAKTQDGRGHEYISQYQYEGGVYDSQKGEFRGFRKVTAIDPQGNKSITYYHQSTELRGMVEKTQVVDSNNLLYSEDRLYYTTDLPAGSQIPSPPSCAAANIDCSIPRFNPVTRQEHFTVNGEGSVDASGNSTMTSTLLNRSESSYICDSQSGSCKDGGLLVLKVDKNFGNPSVTPLLKKTTTTTRFYPNVANWMLQQPAQIKIYQGRTGLSVTSSFDTASTWLSYQELFYDGANDSTTPAQSTRLSKTISRGQFNGYVNDGVSGYAVTKQIAYDPTYKHPITQTDELGQTTVLGYSADTVNANNVGEQSVEHGANIYPTVVSQTVDGVIHAATSNYDAFGRVTSATKNTGIGSIVQTTEYDLFDRPVKTRSYAVNAQGTVLPGGEATSQYLGFCDDPSVCGANLWPDPSDQSPNPPRIRTTVKQDDLNSTWSETYVDNLGRTYLTVSKGEGSQDRCSKTIYNDAGPIKEVKASIPYSCSGSFGSRVSAAPAASNLWSISQSDLLGRPTRVEAPSAPGQPIVTTTSYKAGVTRVFDPRGKCKDYYTNDLGQLSSAMQWIGFQEHMIFYEYDVLGNLTKVTDFNDGSHYIRTTMTYDGLGRKRAMNDPDMGPWTYEYNAAGHLTTQTDAKGNHLEMFYDKLKRLTKRQHFVAGSATVNTEDLFTYDFLPGPVYRGASMDQVVRATSSKNGVEYFRSDLTYDSLGRVNAKNVTISGQTVGFAYSYNVANQPTVLTMDTLSSAPEAVRYGYNSAGLLQMLSTNTSPQVILNNIVYDAAGRTTKIEQGRDANGLAILETNLTYNVNGDQRLYQLKAKKRTSASNLINAVYGYDANGNITSLTDTAGIQTIYSYDDFDRLLTSDQVGLTTDDRTYTYDLNGGMLSVSGNYNPFTKSYGKQTAVASETITFNYGDNSVFPAHAPKYDSRYGYYYDANGNLETLVGPTGTERFEYNVLNKVSKYTSEASVITQYLYDASGARIAKLDVSGNVLERYFGPIDIKNGNKIKSYSLGSRRVAERSPAGLLTFYLQDHLGSNSIQTDAGGMQLYSVSNYEFGAEKSASGTPPSIKYGYTGKRLDQESEQNDYDARSYASRQMHFTTADSIVPDPMDTQSFNRYAYVKNNPMKYVDPSGHAELDYAQGLMSMANRCSGSCVSLELTPSPQRDYAPSILLQNGTVSLTIPFGTWLAGSVTESEVDYLISDASTFYSATLSSMLGGKWDVNFQSLHGYPSVDVLRGVPPPYVRVDDVSSVLSGGGEVLFYEIAFAAYSNKQRTLLDLSRPAIFNKVFLPAFRREMDIWALNVGSQKFLLTNGEENMRMFSEQNRSMAEYLFIAAPSGILNQIGISTWNDAHKDNRITAVGSVPWSIEIYQISPADSLWNNGEKPSDAQLREGLETFITNEFR